MQSESITTQVADEASPLARIREQRSMTQADLAAALGLSQAQVARIEKGKRILKLKHAQKAAEILNCDLLELLGESPRLTPKEEILLAHFRALSETDQDRWISLIKQEGMARAAAVTAFLHGLSDPDREMLAAWAGMVAAFRGTP